MDAVRRIVTLALAGFFAVVLAHADIVIGSKRADVVAELGKPSSSARRGAREILLYPKGVRIELEADVVADIKGYIPPGAPTAAAPSSPETPASAPAPAPGAPEKSAPNGGAPAKKSTPDEEDFNPAIAANALGDEVAKMETAWGGAPPPLPDHESTSWIELTIGLFLRFAYTIVALRVGFKYWEMDAFWSGTLAIAAIDALVHGALIALGPVTGGFTTLGGVENAIPWMVMIFTIRHFCFNKRIQNAVLTAGAVKVVAMLCDIFVSIALLNAFFG